MDKSDWNPIQTEKNAPNADNSEENSNGKILYVPSDTGITQKQTDREMHYFGLISTIPIQGYPFNIPRHDVRMADLFTVLKDNTRDLIPLEDGIIERYEIQDINTSNVHVMYRVPYVYLR